VDLVPHLLLQLFLQLLLLWLLVVDLAVINLYLVLVVVRRNPQVVKRGEELYVPNDQGVMLKIIAN